MRFFALAAAASALRLHQTKHTNIKTLVAEKAKVSQSKDEVWGWLMEHVDQDGNQQISWGEMTGLVDWVCKEHDVSKADCDAGKKEVKKVFDQVDTDGSGEIDKTEFEAAWDAYHAKDLLKTEMKAHQTSDEAWEWILEHIDQDASGTISWPELKGAVKWVCKEHQIGKEECAGYIKEAKAAFEQVDTDGSGDIDKSEFEAAWAAYHA